jgi:hypothetical protein
MGAKIEQYKGIEFVRISSMPREQQARVWESFDREKIIKIVTQESLMNDCILYSDFASWQATQLNTNRQSAPAPGTMGPSLGKLAFK